MSKKPMTPEETARRQKKTTSVRKLAENINGLRTKVTKDMKSDDPKTRLTALAVALMDKTAERVGNASSAKDGHFGVTGFQGRHVTVSGNTINIKYVGKSGVKQEKQVTDKLIAKLIKECKGRCGNGKSTLLTTEDGFQINAAGVNRYLKEYDITAKDIRGHAANDLMVKSLQSAEVSSDEDERKKKFKEVMKSVAERVGHQQATLKQHYLLPGLESSYIKDGKIPSVKEASEKDLLALRVARSFFGDDEPERNIVEDAWPVIPFERGVREVLDHWEEQHDYDGTSWDGIEKFCLHLAGITDMLRIQSAGWYKYPNSSRDGDGKDWRYIIPANADWNVLVNCHSLLHDGHWTLATTVYSTPTLDNISELPELTHEDPWVRSMLWSIATAMALETDGYDFNKAIQEMLNRLKMLETVRSMVNYWKPVIAKLHKGIFGRDDDFPSVWTVAINDWNLLKGKIGSFKEAGELPWSMLTISPRAFAKGKEYLENVVKHELVHATIGDFEKEEHGEKFHALADAVGIPKERQN